MISREHLATDDIPPVDTGSVSEPNRRRFWFPENILQLVIFLAQILVQPLTRKNKILISKEHLAAGDTPPADNDSPSEPKRRFWFPKNILQLVPPADTDSASEPKRRFWFPKNILQLVIFLPQILVQPLNLKEDSYFQRTSCSWWYSSCRYWFILWTLKNKILISKEYFTDDDISRAETGSASELNRRRFWFPENILQLMVFLAQIQVLLLNLKEDSDFQRTSCSWCFS